MRRVGGAIALGALAVVLAIVFLWPSERTGPEPIAWGRDTCARCRMHLSQPGFAGELRDRRGVLTKYDDIGCLLGAMLAARAEIPEAWVQDHASGQLVPLLTATLVRSPALATPMGYGIVAFSDAGAARTFAEQPGAELVALEDLVRDPARLARTTATPDGGHVHP